MHRDMIDLRSFVVSPRRQDADNVAEEQYADQAWVGGYQMRTCRHPSGPV